MPLEAVVRHPEERIAVVELHGRMTHGSPLPGVEAQLKSLAVVKQGGILILDLKDVEYADSAGLGLLVFLNGKMKEIGGRLRIAGANNRILEIFQITQTDTLLTLDPDIESSLSHAEEQISH